MKHHITRTWVERDGKTYRVRMTPDGLKVRQKHSRCERTLRFEEVVDAAVGQKVLPLDFAVRAVKPKQTKKGKRA